MSAEIIPFDFEEQAVRVVLRDGDPWFVAADVCRVLEISNARDAVARLDDDEKADVGITDASGTQRRKTNIISESGLYALIFTSRKAEARKFRKWVTAEVLPSLRATGRYDMPAAPAPAAEPDIAGLPIREAELWLSMVREARLTRGPRAAVRIWDTSPLPPLSSPRGATPDGDQDGPGALAHLLAWLRAEGLALENCAPVNAAGLRPGPEGLFVANGTLAVFAGTRWADGLHRAALLELPGVAVPMTGRTLLGHKCRGVLVPWALIEAEGVA